MSYFPGFTSSSFLRVYPRRTSVLRGGWFKSWRIDYAKNSGHPLKVPCYFWESLMVTAADNEMRRVFTPPLGLKTKDAVFRVFFIVRVVVFFLHSKQYYCLFVFLLPLKSLAFFTSKHLFFIPVWTWIFLTIFVFMFRYRISVDFWNFKIQMRAIISNTWAYP